LIYICKDDFNKKKEEAEERLLKEKVEKLDKDDIDKLYEQGKPTVLAYLFEFFVFNINTYTVDSLYLELARDQHICSR